MSTRTRCARFLVVTTVSLAGCTPSSLQFAQLSPVHDSTVVTAADLFARADSATKAKAPATAAQILIVHADSVIGAIAIYELPDIFWADIYIYNGGSQPYTVNPSQLILMDAVRTVFRPLGPPYQPKYIYDVQSSTQGYLYAYGNYGYYNGTTQTTVTQREDPYNALGYSIGAAIARHRNAKLGNMAGTLYTIGFVEGSSVPAKAGARGGVYWLKRVNWSGPLILRFAQSSYEVRFTTTQP